MSELKPCPFCGKPVGLVVRQIHQEAYIVCSDHNCLGAMDIHWGTEDDPNEFIQRLKSNWNRRVEPEMPEWKKKAFKENFSLHFGEKEENE